MKKSTTLFFTTLLIAGSLNTIAQKLPKRESVNLPEGRNILMQASLNHLGHANGRTTIDIVINKKGDVVSALADRKLTTIKDKAFVHKVEEAVLAMKFNSDTHLPDTQRGSLTYSFR
ncbi:hypothetical protein [Mucilaginibacter sp.]|uniref:hypothetical protein n=1 Tax=Mucilaginibacter sp. TaxID=1882438 RepID=UPI0026265DA5|nr:hypothetical protein [Mucilaginibacter sp.]MDB4925767.1 Energy transducer TonB [Mucilaginibacter sp.]